MKFVIVAVLVALCLAGESAAGRYQSYCDKTLSVYPCAYQNCHNACAYKGCHGHHRCLNNYKCCCTCTGTHKK
uniref:Foot protein 18 n=1 Tax=Mytilus californianus TaxID=6549 RepID=A0A223HCK1_MYTCA|nr:foot protein 18 [Mytilus californianus]